MTREAQARTLLLDSVLTGRELPGIGRSVTFPDLEDATAASGLLLVDDGQVEFEAPEHVTVIGRESVDAMQLPQQQQILEFLPPELLPGRIGVRLRLSIVAPNSLMVPVGEIVATFDDSDPLVAVDPTHVLAF